jgi:hypothetical protein
MKIRNGFVSNSSSSSFIVLGFKVDRDYMQKEDFLKMLEVKDIPQDKDEFNELYYNTLYSINDIIFNSEDEVLYIGKIIYYGNDYLLSKIEYDIFDISEIEKIREKFRISKGEKIKLYTGTVDT